jgi:endonuclease/exonuclease/phosphatase family metal-dependent hydrolase
MESYLRTLPFACLVVALLSNCPAQSPEGGSGAKSASEPLTVMTWNLEWFYDDEAGDNYSKLGKEKTAPSRAEWDWRRDAIASSIAEAMPTVLAVQEVENRRVLWYLSRALTRNHKQNYHELGIESRDHFTEQDVGIMYRPPADAISLFQGAYPQRMRSNNQYYDVSKHLMAVLEFPTGGEMPERVLVMNVHLRSRAEGAPLRLRQARLVHHWIADAIKNGENVILLGDFNTEETGVVTRKESDLGIASGLETPSTDDDLVDLNLRLDSGMRQTHLLEGRQFDRIFCSRSLLEDDPSHPDLVFTKIEVRRDLAVRGKPDTPEQHWESYWKLPSEERDLSDHYPVMATFEVR